MLGLKACATTAWQEVPSHGSGANSSVKGASHSRILPVPIVTYVSQQGHTYCNKATPPNGATPISQTFTHLSLWGHIYSTHHRRCGLPGETPSLAAALKFQKPDGILSLLFRFLAADQDVSPPLQLLSPGLPVTMLPLHDYAALPPSGAVSCKYPSFYTLL